MLEVVDIPATLVKTHKTKLSHRKINLIGQRMIEWFKEKPQDGTTDYKYHWLFEEFATEIGVNSDIFDEWAKDIPKFADAYKKCKDIQYVKMCRGMSTPGSATAGYIFMAKNILKMRDRQGDEKMDLNEEEVSKLKSLAATKAAGNL